MRDAVGVVVFLVFAAGCLDGAPSSTAPPSTSPTQGTHGANATEMYVIATDVSINPETNYAFTPDAFQAKQHETLSVVLKGATGNQNAHTLVITEFEFKIGPAAAGQAKNGTLTLHETGSFKYFCDVGNHRALGMEGTLTVSA